MIGLITFPLLTMILFSIINLSSNIQTNYSQNININGSTIVNGSATNVTLPSTSFSFSLNFMSPEGFILLITSVLVVGSLVGIRALGSGLSETTVELIIKAAFYLGIWGVVSAFAYSPIASVPLFGALIYIGLTLMYVIGFVMQIRGGVSSA